MSIAHEISWSLFSHKGQAGWNCHIISRGANWYPLGVPPTLTSLKFYTNFAN